MMRLTLPGSWIWAAALAMALSLHLLSEARAQGEGPVVSRGENFSAKPPAQLFASDCTGAGCHKGPQGLAKNAGIGLAGFLREHYTNSRESAAALANYLSKLPGGPEPKEARTPRSGRAASAPPPPNGPSWGEGLFSGRGEASPPKREPKESHTRPSGRGSRAAARGEDEPVATPPAVHARPEHPAAEPPAEGSSKREPARGRGTHQPPATATAAAPPPPEPPTPPAPVVEAAPPPPPHAPRPAPPAAKQFDIFD